MNERIEQLADQASHQSPDGYPVTIPYSKDFAEKFAELIVAECMDVVAKKCASPTAYNALVEHFGVEE